jgi:hypothetical protein
MKATVKRRTFSPIGRPWKSTSAQTPSPIPAPRSPTAILVLGVTGPGYPSSLLQTGFMPKSIVHGCPEKCSEDQACEIGSRNASATPLPIGVYAPGRYRPIAVIHSRRAASSDLGGFGVLLLLGDHVVDRRERGLLRGAVEPDLDLFSPSTKGGENRDSLLLRANGHELDLPRRYRRSNVRQPSLPPQTSDSTAESNRPPCRNSGKGCGGNQTAGSRD